MDYLREGIHLRGFAQIDPLVAYKNEAYDLFTELMSGIWTRFAQMIFNVEVEVEQEGGAAVPQPGRSAPGSSTARSRVTYSGGVGTAQPSALATAAGAAGMAPEGYAENGEGEPMLPTVEQRRVADEEQIGRNDPCWCGSGKKYKKCHGA
jgi:preprotein translocase subunit SecA